MRRVLLKPGQGWVDVMPLRRRTHPHVKTRPKEAPFIEAANRDLAQLRCHFEFSEHWGAAVAAKAAANPFAGIAA
jgi:hypothetical protein